MAENVESEIDSVTSSQKSFLKNCPFAKPDTVSTQSFSGGVTETDSDTTEILPNPPVIRTPILSFSSPTSLDSMSDDVFRTPPENASLSSVADSEPRVRVSKSELKSQSSTPVSTSPENVRVLETNRPSDSVNPVTEVDVVPLSSNKAETTPVSASSENVRVSEIKPASSLKSPSSTPVSASPVVPFSSLPPSVAVDNVRTPGDHPDSDSPSPGSIGGTMVWENQPISDSVCQTGVPDSPCGEDVPFKEIIEALLRNSGENIDKADEQVSFVEILRKCGFKFP